MILAKISINNKKHLETISMIYYESFLTYYFLYLCSIDLKTKYRVKITGSDNIKDLLNLNKQIEKLLDEAFEKGKIDLTGYETIKVGAK